MVSVDKAVLAYMKVSKQIFEVLVDCEKAMDFRHGKSVALGDVVAMVKVFTDSKKGIEASPSQLQQAFSTSNVEDAIKIIITKGEINLTHEYKDKLREEKKRQIISIIHRNGVDPRTHLPHPPQRIENAFDEVKFHVDEFKDVNSQVQEALKKLRVVLPIQFEIKEVAVKISPEYAPKCYSVVKSFGTLLREDWQSNGYWVGVVEIPGGIESDFYDKLNKICHGNVEIKVIKAK